MKKTLLFAFAVLTFACQSPQQTEQDTTEDNGEEMTEAETGSFGTAINEEGAITLAELKQQMEGNAVITTKLAGTITECCQTKGCWMTIENNDGDDMRVTFKDYGFFVPKGCAGKTVVMEGKAYYDTLSVDVLRHYAEDAGKSQSEIEKITEPTYELTFEAEGVIIK